MPEAITPWPFLGEVQYWHSRLQVIRRHYTPSLRYFENMRVLFLEIFGRFVLECPMASWLHIIHNISRTITKRALIVILSIVYSLFHPISEKWRHAGRPNGKLESFKTIRIVLGTQENLRDKFTRQSENIGCCRPGELAWWPKWKHKNHWVGKSLTDNNRVKHTFSSTVSYHTEFIQTVMYLNGKQ